MKSFNPSALFQAHCKATHQWGLLLSFPFPNTVEEARELVKAAPVLKNIAESDEPSIWLAFLSHGSDHSFFFEPDENTIRYLFNGVVGDDGPTILNSYSGPVKVYALICDPDGNLVTENT